MKTRKLVLTALMAVLTAVGAFIRIPAGVSAFTLQAVFTALAGLLLGPGYGLLSQALYLLMGLLGLPIFAGGGGLAYVLQPTFGFLLGMLPQAWAVGCLTHRRTDPWRIAAACFAGLALQYLVGLPYMHLILTLYLERDWTLRQTGVGGMLIFLPWDVLKIAVVDLAGPRLCRVLRRD